MPKAKKFPKTLYVTWEDDGSGGTYLSVTDPADLSNFDESTNCAVYDLTSEKGRITVTRDFGWHK